MAVEAPNPGDLGAYIEATCMRRLIVPMTLLAALLPGFALSPAAAASFDCAKATSYVEKLICKVPELSELDETLAETYRQALSEALEPDTLRAEQRKWLREDRDSCTRVYCLRGAYHRRISRLQERVGFTAVNGIGETALAEFLRAELNLESEYSQPRLVPIRFPNETKARRVAFFITGEREIVKRGVIDVSRERPRIISVESYADCHCPGLIAASSKRLAASEPDFVVARFIPRTGTCVGVEKTEVFHIGEGGNFEQVWQGTTYEAYGSGETVVAEIRFASHFARSKDGAILRSAKQIRCGDEDCFCRNGPVISDFMEIFLWDPATRKFRPAR